MCCESNYYIECDGIRAIKGNEVVLKTEMDEFVDGKITLITSKGIYIDDGQTKEKYLRISSISGIQCK